MQSLRNGWIPDSLSLPIPDRARVQHLIWNFLSGWPASILRPLFMSLPGMKSSIRAQYFRMHPELFPEFARENGTAMHDAILRTLWFESLFAVEFVFFEIIVPRWNKLEQNFLHWSHFETISPETFSRKLHATRGDIAIAVEMRCREIILDDTRKKASWHQ